MRSTLVSCVLLIASCRSTEIAPHETTADGLDRDDRAFLAEQIATNTARQPSTTRDAVSRAVESWRAVYEFRRLALRTLQKHVLAIGTDDAVVHREGRLKEASAAALSKVTATLVQDVVQRLPAAETVFVSEPATEHHVVRAIAAYPASGRRGRDGFLVWTQREALSELMLDHTNRLRSTMSAVTQRLDRENPGAGFRLALAIHDAIAETYSLAEPTQLAESLLTWCTFSAQARLGTGDPRYGRDPGTELANHVDVAQALGASARTTPGVLRLELEIVPGHVIVARSFIEGFNSDLAVTSLNRKLGELPIPMIATFRDPTSPRGFVISRNENGAILVDSTGGLMQEMFGGRSDHEAARHIFEHLIVHQMITPKRG
jgi:hypothetical protein